MSVTSTTRLGITRWSSENDAFSRAQMDASHEALETKAAGFLKGTLAARPAAATAYDRFFYLATDNSVIYYCDGTTWAAVSSFAIVGTITPGDVASAGAAVTSARSDHVHAIAGFGVVGEMAEDGTASAGVAAKFARIDHAHGIATGAIGTTKLAASAVTAAKMAADSIATASIIDVAVTTAKLGTSAVTTVKIADDAVTGDKIADGVILNAHIADGTIAMAKLADGVAIPAGTVWQTISVTEPTGWKFFGQTITNCSGNYPNLWAAAPTSWRSGSDLILPTMSDKVSMGGGTLGASGGSNTVTIASANLPTHTHDINHTHAAFNSAGGSAHTHIQQAHTHVADTHEHNLGFTYGAYGYAGAVRNTITPGSGGQATDPQVVGIQANTPLNENESGHVHSISVPPLGAANSGNGGFANTALTTTPAHLRMNFMVKT